MGEVEKVVGFELNRRIEPTGGFDNLWNTLGGDALGGHPTPDRSLRCLQDTSKGGLAAETRYNMRSGITFHGGMDTANTR